MGKALVCTSRPLGNSESNFTKALESGTGITVTGILFQQLLPLAPLAAALSDVLALQPLLRSQIVSRDGKLWFDIQDRILVDIDVLDHSQVDSEAVKANETEERWIRIVEEEMNSPFPSETDPQPAFQARLYRLPCGNSLLVLRLHPAASDIASGPPICSQLFSSLHHYLKVEQTGKDAAMASKISDFLEADVSSIELPCLEDAIPRGQRNKPFWARGIDVVGYGLVSRRHAYLPFEVRGKPTRSCMIRSMFSKAMTTNVNEACHKCESDIYGILIAAALKAVTDFKQVGKRGEHYGVVCLLNCRNLLQPSIPKSAVGFYHAGMMRTIHATQGMGLLELARKCTHDFNEALKNKKHFVDLDDLNMLMVQAMAHPNLTHSGSMRTALISAFHEPTIETVSEVARELKVKDWVTSSSFHGVGACLALFPILRDGALQITYIYCEPLFSRSTAQLLVDSIFQSLSTLM